MKDKHLETPPPPGCADSGPWRDGRLLVVDPTRQALPATCIMTGRTTQSPPGWVWIRGNFGRWFAMCAGAFLCLLAVGAMLGSSISPFLILCVALLFWSTTVACYLRGRELLVPVRVFVTVDNDMVSAPRWLQGLVIICGPVLGVLSFGMLFFVQFQLATQMDRGPLVAATMACLAILGPALAVSLIGFEICRPRERKSQLRYRKRLGRFVWVSGVHPVVLVQLPPMPKHDEVQRLAWDRVVRRQTMRPSGL